MLIALFRDTRSGFTFIRQQESEKWMGSTDLRVSHYVDVDFPMIDAAVKVCDDLLALESARKVIVGEYRKSELPPAVADPSKYGVE